MSKPSISGIQNYENVHRYIIQKQKDIHGVFCDFFRDLGLSEDSVGEVDIIFDDLDNEYLYLDESARGFEIHIFITGDFINLVFKTKMNQLKLNQLMQKYFVFPGNK